MAVKGGPRIVSDGLVFCSDAAAFQGVARAGCMGFNNADQLVKNLANLPDTVTTSSDLRLGNLNFYTLYAISYPEGNYTPANRDGITAGFNNISSGKIYDWTRDLNYAVWDNATNSWVANSYFNGERANGHCYDTYDGVDANGVSEHTNFQNDYYNIVANFPDATHIVVGSHAAENHDANSTTLAILQDLGGPSSWPGGRPEYILVGKPGLGADNAYVWQYENNNNQVAHANVGLPILGRKSSGGNYLEFDGSNDYINLPSESNFISGNQVTVEAWITTDVTGSYKKIFITAENNGTQNVTGVFLSLGNSASTGAYFGVYNTSNTYGIANHGSYLSTGTWTHLTGTYDGSNVKIYVNGSLSATTSHTGNIRTGSNGIGRISGYMNGNEMWDGKIASLKVYTRALTASEVLSNYNATKRRFS